MAKKKKKAAKKTAKKATKSTTKTTSKTAKSGGKAAKKAKKKAPAKKAPGKKKKAPVKAPGKKKAATKKTAAKATAKKAPKTAKAPKTPKVSETKAKPAKAKKQEAPKALEVEIVEEVVDADVVGGEGSEEQILEEIILTDAEGRRYCRVRDCDQLAAVDGYCRYHYLLFWKRIQVRKKILSEGKLEKYVEDLTARYPDKFLDMLRKDLRSEKEFLSAIQELEIDEGNEDGDFEDEDQSFIDEVRGMSEAATSSRDEDEY